VPARAPLCRGRAGRWRLAGLGLLALLMLSGGLFAQTTRPVVYVVPIAGIIDLGLAPFVQRVLDEAVGAEASAVILEINTFGGRVDAAVLIRDALLQARVRTIAFVNKRAISAGALISLAAETIAMADGGTIGAATPVTMGQPGAPAQPVEEKTVSYMRKEFRATAEARKRPPLLAEAMVDADVEIPGVIDKGKLLTLTTDEALQHQVADVRAESIDAVLKFLELAGADMRLASQTWAETLVRFLTHPVVSSLLLSLGMLGLIVELRTPGVGLPGVLGVTSLALFFWGHWLVQLVGWEELLLVGAGCVLLVAIAAALALLRVLPRLPFGRRLVLETEMAADAGYASAPEGDRRWLGQRGTAASPLRPAGLADLAGERVDVVSDGEFIDAGAPLEVIRVDGNRIVVRRPRGPAGKE
jgi:membrane-bound serine protease (ClpP class)